MTIKHYVMKVRDAKELGEYLDYEQLLNLAYAEYKKRIWALISRHESNGLSKEEVQEKVDNYRPFTPRRTEEEKLAARVAALPKEARERFLHKLQNFEARA